MLGGQIAAPEYNSKSLDVSPPSLTERLSMERDRCAKRLEQLDAAIAALKDIPEVSRAVDAIARLGHF